jgi:tRNA pseudouridine38-40 synthase
VFTITADRFLRNMVRAVVGTLFEVGRGKMTIEQFADVITKHTRTAAGDSAPAEGLYLTKIIYPEEIFL